MPKRRVRHRDKVFTYFGLLAVYIFFQLAVTTLKSIEANKTEPITKEDVIELTTTAAILETPTPTVSIIIKKIP